MSSMDQGRDEGVIKYQASRVSEVLAPMPGFEELRRVRDELHALGLIGVYPDGIGYGNASLRLPSGFLISGSGTGAQAQLTLRSYCQVTACYPEENRVESRGEVEASSESMSHAAIYEARPEVHAVLHVHSRTLFEALKAGGAAHTSAQIAYGTPAMATAVRELAAGWPSDAGIFVALGHDEGVFAFGTSPQAAFQLLLQQLQACGLRP